MNAFSDIIRQQVSPEGIITTMGHINERKVYSYLTKEIIEKKEPFFRVSELHDICPREEIICSYLRFERTENISPSTRLTFDIGISIHDLVREKYLGPVGIVRGCWRCVQCGWSVGEFKEPYTENAFFRMPKKCDNCSGNRFKFQEIELAYPDLLLTGHPDGFLAIEGRNGPGLLEIKSQKKEFYERYGLDSPTPKDVTQANTYMWLTKTRWAELFYINKNDSVWHTHKIELDHSAIEEMNERIKDTIDAVLALPAEPGKIETLKSIKLPKRICQNKSSYRAKSCFMVGQCFPSPVSTSV